ncbi:MAG TPA: hypothetical protein VF329_14815 [Gammaproteobacteria bacterium]
MTALEHLRKRKRIASGLLTPLLALAWLGASATPCVGMGIGKARAAAESPAARARDDDHADGGFGGSRHAHSQFASALSQPAPTAEERHRTSASHAGHAGHMPPARPAHDETGHDHGHCPHCPPSPAPADDTHVACATSLQTADLMGGEPGQIDLQHLIPIAIAAAPSPAPPGVVRCREAFRDGGPAPPVPLNVRYCVFLN